MLKYLGNGNDGYRDDMGKLLALILMDRVRCITKGQVQMTLDGLGYTLSRMCHS